MHDPEMMKLLREVAASRAEIEKKYGVKRVGVWTDLPDHKIYIIYEAPTAEAFQRSLMEPVFIQWLGHNSNEIKMVMNEGEGQKMMEMLK
ncbi:MAG: hypothetical protein QG670_600 [Thermoproteota archaeon]|nr:hypothetical protein [Thermoproteota archaeon]